MALPYNATAQTIINAAEERVLLGDDCILCEVKSSGGRCFLLLVLPMKCKKYGPSFCITVSENVVTVLSARNEKLRKGAKKRSLKNLRFSRTLMNTLKIDHRLFSLTFDLIVLRG